MMLLRVSRESTKMGNRNDDGGGGERKKKKFG
jgi:hypothetical protein